MKEIYVGTGQLAKEVIERAREGYGSLVIKGQNGEKFSIRGGEIAATITDAEDHTFKVSEKTALEELSKLPAETLQEALVQPEIDEKKYFDAEFRLICLIQKLDVDLEKKKKLSWVIKGICKPYRLCGNRNRFEVKSLGIQFRLADETGWGTKGPLFLHKVVETDVGHAYPEGSEEEFLRELLKYV